MLLYISVIKQLKTTFLSFVQPFSGKYFLLIHSLKLDRYNVFCLGSSLFLGEAVAFSVSSMWVLLSCKNQFIDLCKANREPIYLLKVSMIKFKIEISTSNTAIKRMLYS